MPGSGRKPSSLFFALLAMACLLLLVFPVAAVGITPVSTPITITGPGTYELTGDYRGASGNSICIEIQSSDVVFDGKGYLLDGVNFSEKSTYGIWVSNGTTPVTNVTIRNVRLTNWSVGTLFMDVRSSAIQGVTMTENENGIMLAKGCTNNIISGSTLNGKYNGIFIASSGLNTVSDNTLAGYNIGIGLRSPNEIIHNNTVTGSTFGIALASDNDTVSDNTVTGNENGIVLFSSVETAVRDNTVSNNTATGNNVGIGLLSASDSSSVCGNVVRDNTVTGNDVGIGIVSVSDPGSISGNTITNNNFNNPDNAEFEGTIGANFWNITQTTGTNIAGGPSLGGNFWGSPDGTGFSQTHPDSNHDGFCDDPNPLGTDNTDNLPLHTWALVPPVANFTSNVTTGKVPLSVQFNDTSTGSPATWSWEFGDSSPANTTRNATHLYETAGTYTVNLTATNSDGSTSTSKAGYITVTSLVPPVANFTSNVTSGKVPLSVQFNDTSTGSPATWSWEFGDLSPVNTTRNATHLYTEPGIYTVNLTATNSDGITSTSKAGYITVTSLVPPVANFTSNVTSGKVLLSVQFNDTSTGSPASWSWEFGDHSPANTTRNATHVYIEPGIYTVNLTATNSDGSTSTSKTGYITVTRSAPLTPTLTPTVAPAPILTAGFYAFGHIGQAPYSVRFLDQSTGSPTAWKWDFGDGSTSTEQNPTHIYTRTGAYNVALTASNDQATDTAIQYRCIIVNTVPVAAFTANATAGRTPFSVQFTDQSTSATGYQWQFGDGTTSTDQNPVHAYTQPGSYTVTLIASAADYGSVSMQKPGYITVNDLQTVDFSANMTAGLSPLPVQFNESTTGSVPYFYWLFGDGGTSFDRNPVHTYNTAGRYTVSLYAIGSNGYQVKTIEQFINVTSLLTPTTTVTTNVTPTATTTVTPTPTEQNLPVANFTVTQGSPGSMGILVTDTSVNATSVRYDLGDGTTTAYPNFGYTYWQAGTYTIKLIATSAAGSSTKNVTVTVPATTPTITFPPIGGDQGWYTIHCNVDGATVLFDQTTRGTIADGVLKIQVYTTGTPYRTYTVQKDGYTTVSGAITDHPGKDQNVDITVTLTPASGQTPYNGPHNLPGTLQAEDYDLGGEGIAYHDTTAGNIGGVYRQDDVDIEVLDTDRSPNVGWIRSGEWLAYTVNVSTAGIYDAGFRVASSHAGSSVQVYVDDGTTPVATVNVPNTGDWPVFQTVQVPVTLPAGQHRLKLTFPTDYVNINWISFTQGGA